MGNPTNKKVPKKRKATIKSMCKSSSNQKENVPKNVKTKASIITNPDDGIAMSKQLSLKKNIARTKRRSSSKPERICPNGKPIPSLIELEKMFEDSDDDDESPKTPIKKPTCATSTPEKQTPTNISDKIRLSPTTINKITERLLGSIQKQNLPDPSELLEATSLLREDSPPPSPIIPPKKKRKTEIPYIVGCKDRPQVISKPSTNFCKGDKDYGIDSGEYPDDQIPKKRAKKSRIPNYSKSIFNAQSDDIAERLIKDDAGDLSDASSDSNKTIEYYPTLFQNPRPHSFSPLPSTSKDSETFKKNDELFNESLREINLINATKLKKEIEIQITPGSPKEKDDNETTLKKKDDLKTTKKPPVKNEGDLQIIEIPYETFVIDDICERPVGLQNSSNIVEGNVIEIIEPVTLEEVMRPKKEIIIDEPNDEDCMIVASSGTINKHNNLHEPIVIDDEYSSINMEFDSFTNETYEIIDVDDIIAENKSILDKWKTSGAKELNKINTIVEVPTTYRNVTSQQTVTPTTTQATQNIETPKSHQSVVIPNTTLQTDKPPSHNNSRTNRNSATTEDFPSNTRPAISEGDPDRSVIIQSILNDFFAETQPSGTPISISEGMVKFFDSLQRLPVPCRNSITLPSPPVNTLAPISTNRFENADNRHQNFGNLRNSSSLSGTERTSTLVPPPSPVPSRNIGDCPICLDPLNSSNGIASTICGHVFCLKCIQASVKTNGKKCPTCRKALKGAGGGYHQLYL